MWFWKDGGIRVHVLRDDRYEASSKSGIPALDLDLLGSFLDRPTAIQAVKAFRAALGKGAS